MSMHEEPGATARGGSADPTGRPSEDRSATAGQGAREGGPAADGGRAEPTDRTLRRPDDLVGVDFAKHGGLVPVVAQDADDGRVLMVAWADHDALTRTLETGDAWFFSRSRQRLWRKGETSGNVLRVVSAHADCDGDTVLLRVRPAGPACHTGEPTCFGAGAGSESGAPANLDEGPRPESDASADPDEGPRPEQEAPAGHAGPGVLEALDAILASREAERPEGSYTARLLQDENLRLKKLGEETTELVVALAGGRTDEAAEEAADLLYHLLVALRGGGVALSSVAAALKARRR